MLPGTTAPDASCALQSREGPGIEWDGKRAFYARRRASVQAISTLFASIPVLKSPEGPAR